MKMLRWIVLGLMGAGLLAGCAIGTGEVPPLHNEPAKQASQKGARAKAPASLPAAPTPVDMARLRVPLANGTPLLKAAVPGPSLQPRWQPRAAMSGFVAHEWGTYTSVTGSNGALLDGLHHEEEPLPNFVLTRGMLTKGLERPPSQVNQKLETPVIYFYTPKPLSVMVKVDFPKGVISEWYPAAQTFAPELHLSADQQEPWVPTQGSMTWKGEVDPKLRKVSMAVKPESIWAPSRQVAAAGFRDSRSRQVEKFIFYRGVGRFSVPFRTKALADGRVELTNLSEQTIPHVFVLRVTKDGGAYQSLGSLGPRSSRTVQPPQEVQPMAQYVNRATRAMAAALEETGLFRDEAWAMVNTWRRSYFRSQTPGIRILYTVPRSWTDALLPITITPKPRALVRTLVGRVELLTPQREAATLAQLREAFHQGSTLDVTRYGRFAEPKLRRVLQLIEEPRLKAYAASLVQKLSKMD